MLPVPLGGWRRPPCAHAETSSCGPVQVAVEVPQIQFFDVVGFQFLCIWVYIDKSLMSQWSCKGRFQLSTGAVEEFHGFLRAVLRYPHLDPGHCFHEPLYLAGTCPGVHASVYGCFWKNVTQCLGHGCARAVRTWKPGHYILVPLYLALVALGNSDISTTSPSHLTVT